MHAPHSPQKYIQLFRDALKQKIVIPFGTLHGTMLGYLNAPANDDPEKFMMGEIFRFVRIDPDQPWFNLNTSEPATEDEMNAIQLPPHLLPNLRHIEFAFHPASHKLWLVTKDRKDVMSARTAAEYFDRLFEQVCLRKNYPKVDVTVMPDKESLETMLALTQLDSMTIELTRPNADDAAELDARWMKRLAEQGVDRMEQVLKAAPGQTIKPDADTRRLAEVASRNGYVAVTGKDGEGTKVTESTISKPMVLSRMVNSEVESGMDVLLRTAQERSH